MTRCGESGLPERLDRAAGLEREELLDHVRICVRCRASLAEDDPSRLFALLARHAVPSRIVEGVSEGVREAIGSSARSAAGGSYAAAWAAALLLAAIAGWRLVSPVPVPVASKLAGPPRDRAEVDVLSSPGSAQVVDLAVGDAQIVMIFDEGLDL